MSVIDFVMPSLGADMESGTIIEWMVETGDAVGRGDIVAIVETDKADLDIEVWDSGTVTEILVGPGQEVSVGTPLARLETNTADVEETSTPARTASSTDRAATASDPPDSIVSETIEPEPVVVEQRLAGAVARRGSSPLARRLAEERGIDLSTVPGSGPGGAVRASDLEIAPIVDSAPRPASAVAPNVADGPEDRLRPGTTPMRRAIAEVLTRSKREIPHYYLTTDVDLEAMSAWLAVRNGELPVSKRILPAAMLLKAVAVSAAEHGPLNGFWLNDGFDSSERVHLGVAVSLRGGGLVAPAIHDADRLPLEELMSGLRDLVNRARSGRLRGSEMTDPTLTVSNLGDRGVDVVHGVIYSPQVALIGLGRIASRPAVIDELVVPRPQVTMSLSADHRASDGQIGARFLNTIDRLLQTPEVLEK